MGEDGANKIFCNSIIFSNPVDNLSAKGEDSLADSGLISICGSGSLSCSAILAPPLPKGKRILPILLLPGPIPPAAKPPLPPKPLLIPPAPTPVIIPLPKPWPETWSKGGARNGLEKVSLNASAFNASMPTSPICSGELSSAGISGCTMSTLIGELSCASGEELSLSSASK